MAIKSFGTRLYIDGDLIGSLTDISPGDREAEVIDVTTHESSDNSREFIGGLVDGGEATFSGFYNYGDDGQDALRDSAGADVSCMVVFSDDSVYAFPAVVKKGTGEENGVDGVVGFSGSLKVSGKMMHIGPIVITGTLTDGTDAVVFQTLYPTEGSTYRSTDISEECSKTNHPGWVMSNGVATWRSTAEVITPDLVPAGDWHTTTNPHAWKPDSPATGTPVAAFL
jgi:hypothetical protein